MSMRFITTGIGSLPFREPVEAVEFSLKYCDIPFWPQLPRRSFLEQMVLQYAEGFPGLRIEEERFFVDENAVDELNLFYERYAEGEEFPFSMEFAAGFYAFLQRLEGVPVKAVKGQTTGPLTFTLGLKDSTGRAVFATEELREIALLLLKRKLSWQIKRLKKVSGEIYVFIDEPILTAIGGSSYVAVSEEEILRLLREVVQTIKSEGAVAGIHCCGRGDWSMIMQTGVDLINFDAYFYFDSLKIHALQLKDFLSGGGLVAWGIVPTTEAIQRERSESILKRIQEQIKELSGVVPEELLLNGSLLTPSCGAGGLTVEDTYKVFEILQHVSEALRA